MVIWHKPRWVTSLRPTKMKSHRFEARRSSLRWVVDTNWPYWSRFDSLATVTVVLFSCQKLIVDTKKSSIAAKFKTFDKKASSSVASLVSAPQFFLLSVTVPSVVLFFTLYWSRSVELKVGYQIVRFTMVTIFRSRLAPMKFDDDFSILSSILNSF